MDFAVAQLALIFLPGIIWANLDAKYGTGEKPTEFVLVVRAFIFGVTTYAILLLIYSLIDKDFPYSELVVDPGSGFAFTIQKEIAWSVPLSLILALLWLYAAKYRLLTQLLQRIRATSRVDDEDIWSFVFNYGRSFSGYVHVRDQQKGHVFAGWVLNYSGDKEYRELLLEDVVIYDDEGAEISRAPHVYIASARDEMWIEFPTPGG